MKNKIYLLLFVLMSIVTSCKELAGITGLVTNCDFSLAGITDYKVAGFNTEGKQSISDFNFFDAAKLTTALLEKDLPVSMVVNVRVDNKGSDVFLNKLDWIALLDNKEMVAGKIVDQISIPAKGSGIVPLHLDLNLFDVLEGETGAKVLKTALSLIAGEQPTENAKLSFKVKPTYTIAGTEVQHPDYIVINP